MKPVSLERDFLFACCVMHYRSITFSFFSFGFVLLGASCVRADEPVTTVVATEETSEERAVEPLTQLVVAEPTVETQAVQTEPPLQAEEQTQSTTSKASNNMPVQLEETPATQATTTAVEQEKTQETTQQTTKAAEEQQVEVRLVVNSPSGPFTYDVNVPKNTSVETVMQKAKKKGLTYETKKFGGMGTYIKTINGLSEDMRAQLFWIFSVNGKKGTVGISSYRIKAGDTISWSFENSL